MNSYWYNILIAPVIVIKRGVRIQMDPHTPFLQTGALFHTTSPAQILHSAPDKSRSSALPNLHYLDR